MSPSLDLQKELTTKLLETPLSHVQAFPNFIFFQIEIKEEIAKIQSYSKKVRLCNLFTHPIFATHLSSQKRSISEKFFQTQSVIKTQELSYSEERFLCQRMSMGKVCVLVRAIKYLQGELIV